MLAPALSYTGCMATVSAPPGLNAGLFTPRLRAFLVYCFQRSVSPIFSPFPFLTLLLPWLLPCPASRQAAQGLCICRAAPLPPWFRDPLRQMTLLCHLLPGCFGNVFEQDKGSELCCRLPSIFWVLRPPAQSKRLSPGVTPLPHVPMYHTRVPGR